jgi:competence protein ComEA
MMLKKIIFVVVALFASISFAFADVDVNKADQAALDGVKGIGPAKSKAILAERAKGGNFKDWADFEGRVKGIGEKNAIKLSDAGLTVNGQAKATVKAEAKSDTKADAKANSKANQASPKTAANAASK